MGVKREWRTGRCRDECGQSTVEFAVVSLVVLTVALGLASLVRLGTDGMLLGHATAEASHATVQPNVGIVGDIAFF